MASFVELKAALYVEFLSRPGGDNFAPFRYLFRWKDAHIDWPFLRAAMRYWYPRYHVFRFGLDEICPVFEEGCAVLGLNPNAAIACPGTSGNLPLMARRWLGLSKNQTRGAVSGRFIHIGMICQHFVAHRYDRWVDLYLPRLVLVLLFLDVLLVNSSPLISLEYLEVVRQAFSGYNYAAIVLGESFVWLDRNRVRSNSGERGSPVLLYIWLSERFKMASRPLLFDNLASSFFDRDRPYLLEGDDDDAFDFWEIWFSGLGLRRIRWRVLWWGVSFVTVRLAGLGCLQYPSFGKPIPYFPFRVGRQFGWDQWYVPLGRRAPVLGEVRLLQSAWSLENRGGEDFNAVTNGHVSFGVAADLAEITAKAIWRDCREGFQLDPVMGAWLEGRDSFEDVYPVYRVIEDDRRANANAREYGTDDDTGSLDGFD